MLLNLQILDRVLLQDIYLINKPQCFLCVEVTLARHVRVRLAHVMLRDEARRAATAGVALTVLQYAALAITGVLALLAPCRQ